MSRSQGQGERSYREFVEFWLVCRPTLGARGGGMASRSPPFISSGVSVTGISGDVLVSGGALLAYSRSSGVVVFLLAWNINSQSKTFSQHFGSVGEMQVSVALI